MINVTFNLQKETKTKKSFPKIMKCGNVIALMEHANHGIILVSPELSEIGSIVHFGNACTWRDFDEPITIANRQFEGA